MSAFKPNQTVTDRLTNTQVVVVRLLPNLPRCVVIRHNDGSEQIQFKSLLRM